MLKQFNLAGLYFDSPRITLDMVGNEIESVTGDGWYPVETQEDVDGIWKSVESNGEVWAENGELKWSGQSPSENHRWDGNKKQWVSLSKDERNAQEAEMLKQKQTALLQALNAKTAELKAKHLGGYSVREEQEARGLLPTMLLDEIFAAGGYQSMEELKASIITKVETLAIIEGALTAKATELRAQIANAQSNDDIAVIQRAIEQWT